MWWYAFFPSLVTTLVGVLYVSYQFLAFKYSGLFSEPHRNMIVELGRPALAFLNDHTQLWIPTIMVLFILLISYTLLPTVCQGALIRIIAKSRRGEEVRVSSGLSLGLLVFLPLLEYHLLVKTFSLFSILTESSFVVRNLGLNALTTLLPVIVLIFIVGLLLTLLFTYSEFFIVLERQSVLNAMGQSAKLVLLSWQHTFLILILMAIIGLRIAINIIAILLIPALLFLSAGYVATITFSSLGMVIGGVMMLIALIIASYFSGILSVFANAVWTFTFLELRTQTDIAEEMA